MAARAVDKPDVSRILRLAALLLCALLVAPTLPAAAEEPFDHWATRFPLTGPHVRVACETCHVGGLFEGTPSSCVGCHGEGRVRGTTRKPFNHVPSSNRCEDCHTSQTWTQARFDHMDTTAPCGSCHNGSSGAPGRGAQRVQAAADLARRAAQGRRRYKRRRGAVHIGLDRTVPGQQPAPAPVPLGQLLARPQEGLVVGGGAGQVQVEPDA